MLEFSSVIALGIKVFLCRLLTWTFDLLVHCICARCDVSASFCPAPFFILDEVDAALDNTNIGKVRLQLHYSFTLHMYRQRNNTSEFLCVTFVPTWRLYPGDQFHSRRVQREHADHCHLSEGGVFLQGWCFTGSLFSGKYLKIILQCRIVEFLCAMTLFFEVWRKHCEPHPDLGPATLPSGWRGWWKADVQDEDSCVRLWCAGLSVTFMFVCHIVVLSVLSSCYFSVTDI